jgi:sulfoxide reductase heme-binding subunit YedZ
MCLTLCWGVLVSTGWIHRLSGRTATKNSHMVLATLALTFGFLHAVGFLFLNDIHFTAIMLIIPLVDGGYARWGAGIIGYEVVVALAISVGLQRFFSYRKWLTLHRLAYPAVALLVVHSFLGAIANGHLDVLWLAGITFLVPTVVLAVLRFVPSKVLLNAGFVEEDA